MNGKTASFTEKNFGVISLVMCCDFNVSPAIHLAPIFANGSPIALETKGIVLDALGFTSRT